jgi:GR25 family glycosyltransferase involved in LPS biosynthesis
MKRELSRVGIEAELTIGLNPDLFQGPQYATMRNRTPGAIGCHMAQVSVMREALNRDKHAFVMEDDLIFCTDIKDRLEHITNFLQGREWDVVWLGGTFHSPAFWHPVGRSKMNPNCSSGIGRDCIPTEDPRIMRTYGAFSTHAYIVNKNSIQKILSLFDEYIHESIGIDWLFIKLQPQLNCFAYVPGCVKQIDNQSDIGTGITKFSGFSKLNGNEENSRYWFQDRKEDFDPTSFQWT